MKAAKVLQVAACSLVVAACGSRTGLLISGFEENDTEADSAAPAHDGGRDAEPDARIEDADRDAMDAFDAPDSPDAEDAFVIDTGAPDVVVPDLCTDASVPLVYVLSENNSLYSFDPPTLTFTRIGLLDCPGANPFSMAVDRHGNAYSVFENGGLYKIDTATAHCVATRYAPRQLGWVTFGMAFSGDETTDHLYVAENSDPDSRGLGIIDTTQLTLAKVGSFAPPLPACELTGTGDGRLFAFCPNPNPLHPASTLAELDPKTATVISTVGLTTNKSIDGFAFAFWGGSFWLFTAQGSLTTVTNYDPATQTQTDVTTLEDVIVGAGVSSCAPH